MTAEGVSVLDPAFAADSRRHWPEEEIEKTMLRIFEAAASRLRELS
jgi:hypothetical protein